MEQLKTCLSLPHSGEKQAGKVYIILEKKTKQFYSLFPSFICAEMAGWLYIQHQKSIPKACLSIRRVHRKKSDRETERRNQAAAKKREQG